MVERNSSRLIAVLIFVIILAATFGGCKPQSVEPEIPEQIYNFINPIPIPELPDEFKFPVHLGLREKAMEKHALNADTIGWLYVPGTTLDNEVLYYPNKEDKFHYLRKDFYGNYSFAGSYFVDYRSKFDGGRKGMSKNNTIYGHSMTDNPNDTLFSQLKKYKDINYAQNTPYIYFATLEEDIAWEVFAVYVTNVSFFYNTPNPSDEDFKAMVDTAKAKSIYDFGVEVGPDDKILTLSTCLYEHNGVSYGYPNNFRYVVSAKMVPRFEELKESTVVKLNATPMEP